MTNTPNPSSGNIRAVIPVCFCLIIFLFLFESCAIGPRIVTEYDSNSFSNNPLHQKVLWTYAWGLVQPKDFNPGCDVGFNHLNKVEVKTNIGFILLSAITLGAVVPVKVEWDCAPPPVNPGNLGDDH